MRNTTRPMNAWGSSPSPDTTPPPVCVLAPTFRTLLRLAERQLIAASGWRRRVWLLLAHECYVELLWHAYYEGVWSALRGRA
jgi:hypothetical protein